MIEPRYNVYITEYSFYTLHVGLYDMPRDKNIVGITNQGAALYNVNYVAVFNFESTADAIRIYYKLIRVLIICLYNRSSIFVNVSMIVF